MMWYSNKWLLCKHFKEYSPMTYRITFFFCKLVYPLQLGSEDVFVPASYKFKSNLYSGRNRKNDTFKERGFFVNNWMVIFYSALIDNAKVKVKVNGSGRIKMDSFSNSFFLFRKSYNYSFLTPSCYNGSSGAAWEVLVGWFWNDKFVFTCPYTFVKQNVWPSRSRD